MLVYFDMSKWSWPQILDYMGRYAPAPVLYDGNGWVHIKTGVIEWNTDRNGCSMYHFKRKALPKLRSDCRFFADPTKLDKPWLKAGKIR